MKTYLGYDPGGNGNHGCAALHIASEGSVTCDVASVATADDALDWLLEHREYVDGFGIDTATCWSGGTSGWRPADLWLRDRYPAIRTSIASPNSLYGSFSINGMYVLSKLRATLANLPVTEAHPKALCFALCGQVYAEVPPEEHVKQLREWCGLCDGPALSCRPDDDHDRDALFAALTARRWRGGKWANNLHTLDWGDQKAADLLHPAGFTAYAWPDA